MKYARIDLSKTNYKPMSDDKWELLDFRPDVIKLEQIYEAYCRHKKFESVMPIFRNEYYDAKNDLIGYYDGDNLVAFSLIRRYDMENAEAIQFAWDYKNPKLRLGIESLKHECAMYKANWFKYLYLGQADEYKSEIEGFEYLGPI